MCTGRLNYAADVKTKANVLNVQACDARDLPSLAWIERDMRTGIVLRGKVKFC